MIKDFKVNDVITDIFILTKCEKGITKVGKAYGKLVLEDSTGTIQGVMWQNSHLLDQFSAGEIVKISGLIENYQDSLQINVTGVLKPDPDEVVMQNLMKTSKYDNATMFSEIIDLAKSVKDPWWSKLVQYFYNDSDFLKQLRCHPAAVSVHHAYCGGLLQHTLNVTKLVSKTAELYQEIDRDLAVATALLHDIGKLHEIQTLPVHDYCACGNFIGHVVESQNMVRDACHAILDFPKKRMELICHCILAHHGQLEWGAPKLPSCAEAELVFCCDLLDSRIEQFVTATDNASFNGEGFTEYNRYLGTRITSAQLFE